MPQSNESTRLLTDVEVGLFDDLVPQRPGLFDDLVPASRKSGQASPAKSGAWGADDELLSDDDVFGSAARHELPAGVTPSTAGAGRGSIVEHEGERQAYAAETRARKGTTRGVLAYAAGGPIDRQELRFEPSRAGAGRGVVNEEPGARAAFTSGSAPYRDKREAIDDAVDRVALGVPADKVFADFADMGVGREEIVARGRELNDPRFTADTRPVTVRNGAMGGNMVGVEPTTAEGIANFGKRVAARGSQALTGAAATAGFIGPDTTAHLLARDERRAQAAMVGTELQRELEALGQVEQWSQVPGAIAGNLKGTAVLLAESVALSAPALATAFMGLPRVAMAAGVGVSSGSLEYGSALSDALGDRGITLLDVDRVAGALRDPKFLDDVRERGAKRGLTIGVIDALTAGMAGKFVEPALAAARAGKVAGAAAVRQVAAGVAKEIGVQMAGGAGGEALGQKLTGDHKPLDIALEAMAEGVSAPLEVRSNLRDLRQAQLSANPQGVLASAAGLVEPLRAEDMPTTPFTPEQVAELRATAPVVSATDGDEAAIGAGSAIEPIRQTQLQRYETSASSARTRVESLRAAGLKPESSKDLSQAELDLRAAEFNRDTWANMEAPLDGPELQSFNAIAAEVQNLFGRPVLAYVDRRGSSASDGFSLEGKVFVNLGDPEQSVAFTVFHELQHVIRGEAKAGNKQSQLATQMLDQVWGMISTEAKQSYAKQYLFRAQMSAKSGAAAMTVEQALANPVLKDEMLSDFMGKRATDAAFWRSLAAKEPATFKAFVQRWAAAVKQLVTNLRGMGRSGHKDIDRAIANLERAKLVAERVVREWAASNPRRAAAQAEDGAASAGQIVARRANNDPEIPGAVDAVPTRQDGQVPTGQRLTPEQLAQLGLPPGMGQPSRTTGTNEAGTDRPTSTASVAAQGEQTKAPDAAPGRIARGSIADEARKRLEARQTDADAPAYQAGAQRESSAADSQPSQQPASSASQPPARSNATTQPVATPSSTAGAQEGNTSPAPAPEGQRFSSSGQALAWVVERRLSDEWAPTKDGDAWRLQPRQSAAEAPVSTPPQAARDGADAANPQPRAAQTQPTLPNAPPSAAPTSTRVESSSATAAKQPASLQNPAVGAVAAHADPGQPAEPVTPPIAAASVAKAAAATDRKPAELRADLVRQIDAAAEQARPDPEDAMRVRMFGTTSPSAEALAWLKGGRKVSAATLRDEWGRIKRGEEFAAVLERVGHVTLDVPGDGKFTVLRTPERLAEFKRLVERSAGFKAQRASTIAGTGADGNGGERASPSVKAAIENMLAEGDAQAAVDYLATKGLDAAEIGLPASMLAKLVGVTPTAMQDGQADGTAPTEPVASPAAAAPPAATQAPAPSATNADAEALSVRPAELTIDAFIKAVTFARDGNAANPWSARWRDVQLEADAAGFDHPDLGATVVAGARFFPSRKLAVAAAKAAHRRAVQRALRLGEPVPDAVLADYPDLAPKPVAETATSTAVTADTLGIDRQRLVGRKLTFQVEIEETGDIASVEVDAAAQLDDIDKQEEQARAGTITSDDSAIFAGLMDKFTRSGIAPSDARRRAIDETLATLQLRRADAAQLIREQHPDLFVGARRFGDAGAADAVDGLLIDVPVDDGNDARTIKVDAGQVIRFYDGRLAALKSGQPLQEQEDKSWLQTRITVLVRGGATAADARDKARSELSDSLTAERAELVAIVRRDHPSALGDAAGSGSAATQAGPQRIEDFGEVIPGARKDAARAWADKVALAETLTAAEEPLSKSWPEPDYQRLVDGGVDPYLVAFAHAVRDSVPQKPSAVWKLKGWAANVTALRDLAKMALTGQATPERVRAGLAAMPSAHRDIAGVADLYRELGHGVSLKGITLQRHEYSFRDGKHHVPPLVMWTVEKPARATAMSNWPNELATGATKEEAIAAFKPRHQLMLAGAESAAPKAPTRYDIVAYRGKPGVTIGKKVGREFIGLKTFDTPAEARQFRQENPAELDRLLAEAKQVPPERRAENLPRIGVDHRDAGDVTPVQFTEAFGFRGVQFGNYVEGDRRQRDLNDAYDALMDLAGVLGLPPRSLSLGGTIGLAFGARGHGGKNAPSAHFETARVAINLTKGGGAGSLAHEWFHAADNAFARQRNEPLGFLTQRPYARGAGVRAEMVAAFKRLMDTIKRTGLAARSSELDKTRSKPYWSTDLEMAARSFEHYVVAKLQDQGAANDYLANIVSENAYGRPGAYPYPTAAESTAIRAAFDEFFATVQTREDDAGNVALFQRRGGGTDQAELNALRALSQNDELFALPRSGGRTVEEIAADIDPQIKIRTSNYSGQVMHRLTMPNGSFAFIIERKPNPLGPDVYGHDSQDQPIMGRPGVNPEDVDPTARDIFIDASNLSPGGAGREVYAIAAALAHNTDAIFIGDPAGLSDEALRRRPEQMLSSALKYGTTAHLAPHPRQVEGDASLGVPPLRWIYGDDLGNIRRLVDVNLAALQNAGLNDITFDPASGHFTDAAGHEIGRSGIGARVAAGVGRSALAGSTTLARGAVLRALVREEGAALEGSDGRGDGLLARLAGLGSNPDAAGLFYARQPGAAADPVADPDRLRLVRAAVKQVTATWRNAPAVEVLASMQDAPERVRAANIRQLAAGAQGQPAAFYFGGKVFVLAGQMNTQRDVAEAVAHEALGHLGLRGNFGPELGKVLDELAVMREADVRAKAAEYGLNYADKAQRQQAAEEVLAELAQTQPELDLVQRAIAAIRTWLRKNIPLLADLELSDAEVIRSFILPARAFVVDGQPSADGRGAAAFARRQGGDGEAPTPIFRSELMRKVQDARMTAAPGSAWKGYILGLSGVKADEIAWSGIEEWLDLQPGKLSREAVAGYLADNGVQVDETLIGSDTTAEVTVRFDADYRAPGDGMWVVYADGKELDTANTREDAEAEAEAIRNDPAEMAALNGTEFGSLVLPGGKHYRELLLTLPGPSQFESRHWPGHSNVLAHLRVNERSDEQGRHVLFVEELQSDWSAELRKQAAGGAKPGSQVAPAPFVGKVDAWVGLAIKRLVAYAAHGGFDAVAFVSGEQAHRSFPYQDADGGTLAGLSRFYGEANGVVLEDDGRPTDRTPVLHNVARDVLRKLGGGELTTLRLGAGRGRARTEQMGFEITPDMRQAVADGLPLFSRRSGRSSADGFRAWLDKTGGDTSRVQFTDSGRSIQASTVPDAPFLPQRETLPDTIEVDGLQRPTTDASGRPMALDEDGVRSFWRWFGNSRAVDAAGRPLTLYAPAREDIKRLRVASQGAFGSGIYLSADASQASARAGYTDQGAPNVIPVYAAMQRPYVYEGASHAMPAGFDALGRTKTDSAAGGLVAAILPRSSAEQMLNHMARGKVLIGDVIRKRLIELGHDGLIVRFADPSDGPPQYIAFKPEQAKSAIGNDGAFDSGNPDIRHSRRGDEPQPLYVSRPVANAGDILAWARSQGIENLESPDKLHVTVAFSRDPVSPAAGGDAPGQLVSASGEREVKRLGDEGAVVLRIDSPELHARWQAWRDAGASWDFESYQPHVTLTYDPGKVDLAKVQPYRGAVVLGPEKAEPLDLDEPKGDGASEAADDIRFQRRVDPEQQPASEFALRPFGKVGRALEVMQDRYNRWKHAIDDVRRQGGTITDDNDFRKAEERYWGQVGSGLEDFKGELTTWVKDVRGDGLTVDDVALYAYAQHAEERNELVARRRQDMPDGGSGMTTSEADEILQAARDAGVEAELQRHAATLRRWIQGTRQVLLQGGLIDQDQHDTWAAMFQQYVPLRGAGEDTDAAGEGRAAPGRQRRLGGVRGDEAEHAEGRQARALQIVEQIAHDRARALIRVGRNEVLRSFARFVLDNPSPSLWEVNAVERRRTATVDEDGHRTMTESESVITDGRTITLKDNGEEVHILVKDAKLLEQLQRLGVDEHPAWAIGALLSANRWLSRVYTSLSPVFTAINGLRDTQAAAIGIIDEIGFMGAPKLFAALPRAWVDSFKAEAGRPSADYQVFKALGGVTHFHNLTTIDHQAKELASIVADAERMAIDPRKFLPKAMALIEALNGGIENATRLAAFNVARQSGKSVVEAASIAKNITVNFNRRGTQQLANAWVLFWNPAVQGTARLAKAMTSPKVQAAVGTAMLGVAALALRNAGMGDDDDGVAWWDKIPDEVKERNIVIVLPPGSTAGEAVPKSKTGRYVKVPMPYGYNFFAVVANQMVDVWRNSQDARRGRDVVRAGIKSFSAFASSWLPAGDLGREVAADDAESAGKSGVLLLVPDALDPLARIGVNQDSFGRPMRPDSRFSRNLPDSAGYFSGQHGNLFQRGAANLNEVTGGSRFRSGMVDVAPATIEHLARSYGGGPVSFGLDIINALYVRQAIERPEMDAKRLPFVKQFYGVIDAETDRMTGYHRLEAAEKLIDPIKRAMGAGDADEVRAMREDAGSVAYLGDAVLQTRQRLGEIVKRERATIDSTTLNDSAKYVRLLELAEQRRAALQRFNAAYDRAVDATDKQEEAP